MFGLVAGCEGLDDDHAAAAAATGTRQHAMFVGSCGLARLGRSRARRYAEQFTPPCDVGGAIAVGEQSIVADAVQALGQHVHQKAPNELVSCQRHGLIAQAPRSANPSNMKVTPVWSAEISRRLEMATRWV